MEREMFAEEKLPEARPGAQEGKKTVLLIGDSIRVGYCETVRAALADIAQVVYPAENCRHTHHVLTSLRAWQSLCPPEAVDAVLFNCGHWDAARWNGEDRSLTPLPYYEENIGRIARLLGQMYGGAKIVFATTTPMNPNGQVGVNPRTTEDIRRYNEAGVRAAKEEGALILDLFAQTESWPEACYIDYCHYTPEAFARLGGIVAGYLKKLLTEASEEREEAL